ncbi:glycosyltransferase [Metabacillus litoralis]|uniref:glycosyltransferase n=1 Tax=Metabacillus litoralis TaxID=152268 RepID=UPI00203BF7C5|nr:glycosyltransferase [Metabacillus litoralis]MCM3162334.1 glycosyltransferase [Metabacillus litoralis]
MINKPTLSICMMVKNEEGNMKRCLDSLLPLLNNRFSELIIIDTGSTDQTVEIAKLYTDKVYHREWNNDFSSMRNYSISKAVGDWLFIIDADEELVESENLIKIFSSKNICEYNTIQLKLRNFSFSNNMEIYSTMTTPRIFKNDRTFRYEGTVHNQPRFKKPILDLQNIFLNHYGYVKDNQELMENKFKRTSTLLKNELKKNPMNVYYQFQLAQSYALYGRKEQALTAIERAYSMLKNDNEKKEKLFVFGVYANLLYLLNKNKQVIKICNEGINLVKENIDLYYFLASAQEKVDDKELAIKNFITYFQLIFRLDELIIGKNAAIELSKIDSGSRTVAACKLSRLLMEKKSWEAALEYTAEIDDVELKLNQIGLIYLNKKDFDAIIRLYNELESDKKKEYFEEIIEGNKFILDKDETKKLYSSLAKGESKYNYLNKIRSSTIETKSKHIQYFFSTFELSNLPYYYYDVFGALIDQNQPTLPYFMQIDDSLLAFTVTNLLKNNSLYFNKLLLNTQIREYDLQLNRVINIIASQYLQYKVNVLNNKITENEMGIFEVYLETGFSFIKEIYQENKFRSLYKTMGNTEHKVLISLYLGFQLLEKNNKKGALNYFKDSIKIYPKFRNLIQQKYLAIV